MPSFDDALARATDEARSASQPAFAGRVGIVAIGRNEGERLRRCLLSIADVPGRVYVDSGSTDGSQALAQSLGCRLVELAVPPKFTAARARNGGLAALIGQGPGPEYVQMVDGDCEVDRDWLAVAVAALDADPGLAVVFGRRRERFPDASVYNLLCDEEWDVPVGPALSCGGDALFRVAALRDAGGYNPELIAGEEPDLCLRLRAKGWRIERLPVEMTLHDAAMTRFGQWWRRTERSGHAFAELAARHGAAGDRQWTRQTLSALVWGALWAVLTLSLLLALAGSDLARLVAIALLAVMVVQVFRLSRIKREKIGRDAAMKWAMFNLLGKLPQSQGALSFWLKRALSRETKLIEYKN